MPDVSIEKLTYGGSGIGRISGKACFIPFSAPGDQLSVSVLKSKISYDEARIDRILTPSDHRVTPPCKYFGVCGGCGWQHVSYDEQLIQKTAIVSDALWRGARIGAETVRPMIPSLSHYNYRRRIQLKVNFINGRLSIGFFRQGSHYVIDIADYCHIAHRSLNNVLPAIRSLLNDCGEPEKVPQVDLSCSETGSVAAIFHYIGKNIERFSERVSTNIHCIDIIKVQTGRKSSLIHLKGEDSLEYSLPSPKGDLNVHFAPEGFSQVNFEQNRNIAADITDYCCKFRPDNVLDLFCGNGNFSLPIAALTSQVTGFENFSRSIAMAKKNSTINRISNAAYYCLDANEALDQIKREKLQFDLAILDPPRTGAAELSSKLYETAASSVIYISCDPQTLARDLSILQHSGYKVSCVQPFDMFPQTYHIETVVYLESIR